MGFQTPYGDSISKQEDENTVFEEFETSSETTTKMFQTPYGDSISKLSQNCH